MDVKKISVIITSHKGSNSVKNAVISVINQNYANIEIIVVDDNGEGTEEQIRTRSVLEEFIDSKIILYIAHKTNKNGSAARNTGFSASTGEYVCFLDDDDIYLNDKLKASANVLDNSSEEYGAVYTNTMISYSNGKNYIASSKKEGNLLFEMLTHTIFMNPSALMIKRSVVEKMKGFDTSFKRHQDFEFNDRLANECKILHINIVGSQYNCGIKRHYDSKLAVDYRTYYLEKMEPLIMSLPESKRNIVYARNAIEILGVKLRNYKKIIQLTKVWGHKCSLIAYLKALYITYNERLNNRINKY